MTGQLFDIPESLSPKVKFLRENFLQVFPMAKEWVGLTVAKSGEIVPAWVCRLIPDGDDDQDETRRVNIGGGATADDAILDWCEKAKIKHWSVAP